MCWDIRHRRSLKSVESPRISDRFSCHLIAEQKYMCIDLFTCTTLQPWLNITHQPIRISKNNSFSRSYNFNKKYCFTLGNQLFLLKWYCHLHRIVVRWLLALRSGTLSNWCDTVLQAMALHTVHELYVLLLYEDCNQIITLSVQFGTTLVATDECENAHTCTRIVGRNEP